VAPPPTAEQPTMTPGQATAGSSIGPGPRPGKVLVVIEENHSAASALQDMPFLASLAGTYGQATNYQAVTHPSLPNYLAIVGGSTFGVTDDKPPASRPIAGDSVLDAALAAGGTAKTYAEAMPGSCATASSGTYAVKHNPWAYFSDPVSRANCQRFDLPSGTSTAGALHDDINAGTLPTVGLLIPDLCNDAHNCPLSTADNWLQQWIPTLMQGPDYRAGRLTIVVTFDEDDNTGSNVVLTTVVAPDIARITNQTPLTHYSLTRYLAEIAGAPPPAKAAAAPSLRDAFGL
jgi:phospholipase C